MRRMLLAAVALTTAISSGLPANADDEGIPVYEKPVLRSDSQFEETSWGFKRKDLNLPPAGANMPAVLTQEGYSGAGVPNAYLRVADGRYMAMRIRTGGPGGAYIEVNASTRGTECSGGTFNLYDRRHAFDAREIIEWLGTQPWSNGNVGMIGWSFSGQTAYWTAATQPPHLKAVAPSLLHSDIYRDIFMPGGIQNYAFPVVWYSGTPAAGPHRTPTSSLSNGNIPNDEICTQNQLNRQQAGDPPAPTRDYLAHAAEPTDNDWYQMHAATTHAPAIRIPYMQQNNWQDEQTGPRAAVLHHYIKPDPVTIIGSDGREHTVIPKKMLFSNGDHGHGSMASNYRWAFFDIFLRGKPDVLGLFDDADGDGIADRTVENYFEIQNPSTWVARKTGENWPFDGTQWTRFYARSGQGLTRSTPDAGEGSTPYVTAAPARNHSYYGSTAVPPQTATARNLPDAVVFETEPLTEDLAIAGPILLKLYASMVAPDADFFVSLNDVQPDGRVSYLQRGLLKASHRDVDPTRSWFADDNGEQILVQPYRPHSSPRVVPPNEIVKYDVEVFPVGHIFRAGHRIRIAIHTPPAVDGLWGYTATHHQSNVVNVWHQQGAATELLLPVVDGLEYGTGQKATCPVPGGFPCTAQSGL